MWIRSSDGGIGEPDCADKDKNKSVHMVFQSEISVLVVQAGTLMMPKVGDSEETRPKGIYATKDNIWASRQVESSTAGSPAT